MAVVKTGKIGNCNYEICDDYIVKTQEEKDQILRDIAAFYVRCIENGTLDVEKLKQEHEARNKN